MKYLYFSAPWCGPCRMLGPRMKRVAEQVSVEKINVDEDSEMAKQYFVRNLPTVVLVDSEGKEQERFVGIKDEKFYLDKIAEYDN
jgi:thioredoxin 1